MKHTLRETEKQKQYADTVLNLYKLFHVFIMTLCVSAAWYMIYYDSIVSPYFKRGNYIICAMYGVLYFVIVRIYGGFQVNLYKPSELVYSQFFAIAFSDFCFYGLVAFLSRRPVEVWPLLLAFCIQITFAAIWSRGAVPLYQRVTPVRKTVVVYGDTTSLSPIERLYKMEHRFHVTHTVTTEVGIPAVLKALKGSDAAFICGVESSTRNDILKFCIEENIDAFIRPRLGDLLIANSRKIHMFNVPFLYCQRSHPKQTYTLAKRGMDILFAAFALLLLSPFMLLTALCIKCYDGGPILYKQCRLTKNGKRFDVLKFRSMRVDAEKDGVARLASENDDRITPVGKLIRKIRFDELPQIFNILGGSMTLVGPRPERPEIAAQYEEVIPEFSLRLQVKAGLTGYAQIYGKYNTTPYDKLQMDLLYIAEQSVIQDLKLMLMTVKVIFMAESTEGVAEGQETATSNV